MGMTRYEALREIERKRQGYAANDWAAWLDDLESWVAELLEAKTYEEGREDGVAESADDWQRGYDEGRRDLVEYLGAKDEDELREKLARLAELEATPRRKVRA